MTITLDSKAIVNPEVLRVLNVAHEAGIPASDTLFICTGTVVFQFGSPALPDNFHRDTLVFPVAAEDGNPLSITPDVLLNSAATVSLSSISTNTIGNTLAVDKVDITQSDAEEGLIFVNANLAASSGGQILRLAYQVNLLVGPVNSGASPVAVLAQPFLSLKLFFIEPKSTSGEVTITPPPGTGLFIEAIAGRVSIPTGQSMYFTTQYIIPSAPSQIAIRDIAVARAVTSNLGPGSFDLVIFNEPFNLQIDPGASLVITGMRNASTDSSSGSITIRGQIGSASDFQPTRVI